jgi:hypothetical protein
MAIGGWTTLVALVVLASGGAASRPGGLLVGLPSMAVLAMGLGCVAVLAALGGLASGRAAWGLALAPTLVLLAPRLPAVAALSGRPLSALLLAGGLSVAVIGNIRPSGRLLVPVLAVVYVGVAARVQARVGLQGDEPHYLVVADSLLHDHDLDLRQDFADERYKAFHPEHLEPHFRVRGRHGEIYSIHAIGLSLLLLPAYALGGYPAASFFMALLAALLAGEVRKLASEWSGSVGTGEGVGWLIGLSPPLIHYAGLLFTEVPAALGVAVALRVAGKPEGRGSRAFLLGVVLAGLPWLNVRYAPIPVLVFLYFLSRRPSGRSILSALVPLAVSALALAAYHSILYGFFDPRRVYGRTREFSIASLPNGLAGLFLDQEFGLLVYAPVFALAVPGLVRLARRSLREAVVAVALVLTIVLTAGSWDMWRGGFNPPARFLVPLLPVLAAAVACDLRRGLHAAGALLIGWGLWTGLAGGWRPELVHRDRDGTAPFFRAESGAKEWTTLLPGFVLGEPDHQRLALTWGVALAAAAAPWPATGLTGMGFLGATLGLLGAIGVASHGPGRSGGRDAVRLVGRPALEVPRWTFREDSDAQWTLEDLGWGPAFEAARFPGGASLGSRLMLCPGRYAVEVVMRSDFPAPDAMPRLLVVAEGSSGVGSPTVTSFRRESEALMASFQVAPRDRAVSLRMVGGGPVLVESVCLRRSTVWPPAGLSLRDGGGKGAGS